MCVASASPPSPKPRHPETHDTNPSHVRRLETCGLHCNWRLTCWWCAQRRLWGVDSNSGAHATHALPFKKASSRSLEVFLKALPASCQQCSPVFLFRRFIGLSVPNRPFHKQHRFSFAFSLQRKTRKQTPFSTFSAETMASLPRHVCRPRKVTRKWLPLTRNLQHCLNRLSCPA